MHYVMGFFPSFGPALSDGIRAIREAHDPTATLIAPHVTLLFPTSSSIGEDRLIDHLEGVLKGCRPFETAFGPLSRSGDHWLFLEPEESTDQFQSIYRGVYSGILHPYRSETFQPHIGLGLFLREGRTYDYRNPQEADLDRERYDVALREAQRLPCHGERFLVDRLQLCAIPDSVAEWTVGKRAFIPTDAGITKVRDFALGRNAPL